MVALQELAHELHLSLQSVRYHCKTRDIERHMRLPRGCRSGLLIGHVTDDDADAIRAHYADRLASVDDEAAGSV